MADDHTARGEPRGIDARLRRLLQLQKRLDDAWNALDAAKASGDLEQRAAAARVIDHLLSGDDAHIESTAISQEQGPEPMKRRAATAI